MKEAKFKAKKKGKSSSEFNSDMFSDYRALDFKKVYLKKVIDILKKIDDKKKSNVLDIGCADGSFSHYLDKIGFNVTGMDVSEEAVKIAKRNGVNAITHDISEKFPFEPGSFDIVVMMEVIEHVYDTDFVLEEIRRVLKKNGLLVITTPNLASFENRIRLLIGKYPRLSEYRIGKNCSGHIRNYTKGALTKQLREHDFTVMNFIAPNAPFPIYLKLPNFIKRIAIKLGDTKPFNSLGYQLIVTARKN